MSYILNYYCYYYELLIILNDILNVYIPLILFCTLTGRFGTEHSVKAAE
jgi:hypothetical protein